MPYRHLLLASAAIILASSTAFADAPPVPRLSQPKAVQPAPTPPTDTSSSSTDTSSTSTTTPSNDTSTPADTSTSTTAPSTDTPPVSTILSNPPDSPGASDTPNPAFVLTGEQCAKAIDKGIKFATAGKPISDMLKDVCTGKFAHKGDAGHMCDCWATCYAINGSGLASNAYWNVTHYKNNDDLKTRFSTGVVHKFIEFEIQLGVYGVNEDYVHVTDFILTDDKGDMLRATPYEDSGASNQGYTYHGSRSEDQYETITDADGNQLKVKVSVNVPYTNHYSIESEHYRVKFQLKDDNGKYLISSKAKSMTLHLVTSGGEKSVKFDLRPPRI